MKVVQTYLICGLIILFSSCRFSKEKVTAERRTQLADYHQGEYGYDLVFLKKATKLVELVNGESRLVIAPEYQGRVMTSSTGGLKGVSQGWINYDWIESQKVDDNSNPYGGEDRIWLGPEGGQFSVFFAKGTSSGKGIWRVPAPLDHEEFLIRSMNSERVIVDKDFDLENNSGNKFKVRIARAITLLDSSEIRNNLGFEPGKSIHVVAYQSENRLMNIGDKVWEKETGGLSIWELSMLRASPAVVVILPYRKETEEKAFTDYFGDVPESHLKVTDKAIFFHADGNCCSKIGISPKKALPYMGSYDAKQNVLSIIQFSLERNQEYVNSLLEDHQDDPFSGDAVNFYNDGLRDNGSRIGQFYELETSSPAAFLKPGEEIVHTSRMYHFEGNRKDLDLLSRSLLYVSLDEIKNAFNISDL